MPELFIKIFGRIQGVSFRYQALQKGNEWGLVGFVKNAPDGSAEILAQGSKENLEKLLDWVKNYSGSAEIKNVKFEWRKPQEKFAGFEIRY